MKHIEVRDLTIQYTRPKSEELFTAVENVSLAFDKGEFVTIVGPSGCGKSTLLLAIAGLIDVARGETRVAGRPVTGPGSDRAMVFQEASLLPWRTVLGNVRFGLEMQRWSGGDPGERARRFIELVGLGEFTDYHPHQLSGGMRQRVNIARALAVDPDVLLMDEPFGALDAQTREIMGNELLRIWEHDRKTALFVTHDIDEALLLGDQVVVMGVNPGHIKDVIRIDLARPRRPEVVDTEQFIHYRRRLRGYLAEDMQRMGMARVAS